MDAYNDNSLTETAAEENFEELLNQGMGKPVHFNPGEKVEAVITQITKEWIFVDVGGKSDGSIMTNECIDDEGRLTIKEGDTINAYFLSSKHNDMLFTTRLTGDTAGNEHLEEAYRSGIPVEGRVEREIKGGFEVKIGENTRAFCPHSQMGLYRVEDKGQYIGQHVTFKIIEFNKKGRNIVVSNRTILEEERQIQRDALRASLEEGMTVRGEITSIHKFGAFVDIGGLEGLIPISEMSWGRVEDINSAVSLGQKVDVVIKKLDWKEDRFSFSLKDMLPNPWNNIVHKYPEGSFHKGKVSRLVPFGAFVTLEPGIDGLLHISELGKEKRIRHPREVLGEDQTIEVKIARVDEKQRRLSLTMVSDGQDAEGIDDYKKHMAAGTKKASGALGSLGDILRAKMNEKNK
ncbi:MAG: 30S ribosomal protein S1 [Thermodesulfobacteriota bacterium]|nr:30S ribosomal protein S1 [Thermodesulfobacteriota bacterium]